MCLFASFSTPSSVKLTHVHTVHNHGSNTGCNNILDDSQPLPSIVFLLLLLLVVICLWAQKLLHLRKEGQKLMQHLSRGRDVFIKLK